MKKKYTKISKIDGQILKNNVRSICPKCFRLIYGQILIKNQNVILKRHCNEHGYSEKQIEIDPEYYMAITNNKSNKKKTDFTKFTIPITKNCNMNCIYCYFHSKTKNDPTTKEIKDMIRKFPEKYISLSGGEPTLQKNLLEIVSYIKQKNKISNLSTNGLELENKELVKKLKQAGLNYVHLSLNSLDNDKLLKMHKKEALIKKQKAINNLKKYKIETIISFLLQKNINEKDLKNIIHFSLKNNKLIHEIRVRSTSPIAKYKTNDGYYMSEMLDLICSIIDVKKKKIISKLKKIKNNKRFCNLNLDLLINYKKNKINVVGYKIKPVLGENKLYRNIFQNLKINKFTKNIIQKLSFLKMITYSDAKILLPSFKEYLKFKDNFKTLRISLRCWPNEHTLDLDLIDMCQSLTLNYNNEPMPFCLSNMYNNAKIKGLEKNFLQTK